VQIAERQVTEWGVVAAEKSLEPTTCDNRIGVPKLPEMYRIAFAVAHTLSAAARGALRVVATITVREQGERKTKLHGG